MGIYEDKARAEVDAARQQVANAHARLEMAQENLVAAAELDRRPKCKADRAGRGACVAPATMVVSVHAVSSGDYEETPVCAPHLARELERQHAEYGDGPMMSVAAQMLKTR